MAFLKPQDSAPPFEARDQTGRTVRLADFAGGMLFMSVWDGHK